MVISGAEQKIQSLWNLSSALHGVAMAAAVYGTVLGSLLGGWPTDRFGRKITLTSIGILYIFSAVGCGFAWDVVSFVVARFVGGLGIGISTVAAPLYISEISPPAYRGRLAGMFQFNIVFGILVAFATHWVFAALLTTFFPLMIAGLSPGHVFHNLLRHDGSATRLGEDHDARDERRAAGGNAGEAGHPGGFGMNWNLRIDSETTMNCKVLCIGEVLWDIIRGQEHIGGAPFNLAAHLARLGCEASILTRIGSDARGAGGNRRDEKPGRRDVAGATRRRSIRPVGRRSN